MPILSNARHERFVQALIRGSSQCDAYLAAGYNATSSSAAYAHAARLVRNGKVRARLNELQSKEEIKSLLTVEQHMEELRALREIAKANGQLSAAIRAEELRGKLRGFYVDQVQHRDAHGFEQMTDEQLRDYIVREAAALGLTIKPTNGVGKQPSQGAAGSR
jgi:phage terminase small subunit